MVSQQFFQENSVVTLQCNSNFKIQYDTTTLLQGTLFKLHDTSKYLKI